METLADLLQKNNHDQIRAFLQSSANMVLSDWAHAANSAKMLELALGSATLCRCLDTCASHSLLDGVGSDLVKLIIKDHMKIIYRSLNLSRQEQTVPALVLLEKITRIFNGRHAQELYTEFDMSLKPLPKILSRRELRPPMVAFYVALIENLPYALRSDLLGHKRILGGWVSSLQFDKEDLLESALNAFVLRVVKDPAFSKSAKITIFNTRTLIHMSKLLALGGKNASLISEFMMALFRDSDHGLAFADKGITLEPNNKLALSVLKALKPWESAVQMDLVLFILQQLTELFLPYFAWLKESYSFNPKLSMFWFSFSVLHQRVLRIPLPSKEVLQAGGAHLLLFLVPQTLTRSAMNATLSSEKPLIKLQGAQILLFLLKRLKSAQEIMDQHGQSSLSFTFAGIANLLPDPNLLLHQAEESVLQTTLLACIHQGKLLFDKYTQCFPGYGSLVLGPKLTTVLDNASVAGIDLITAQYVLQIQTHANATVKWYNRNKDLFSPFTKLSRFASRNPELGQVTVDLLKNMTECSLLFQKDTFASPIEVFLHTLEVCVASEKYTEDHFKAIWQLIDEAVSRCMRSPYAYIDEFPVLVSPFAVACVQQASFVESNKALLLWLRLFLNLLGVIGEDREAIKTLKHRIELGDGYVPLADYPEFVLFGEANWIKSRKDLTFKISTKLDFMATVSRAIITDTLTDYLLRIIPESFSSSLLEKDVYSVFFKAPQNAVIFYLEELRNRELSSPEFVQALETSEHWETGIDFLPSTFIMSKLQSTNEPHALLTELKRRDQGLPFELVSKFLDDAEIITKSKLSAQEGAELMKRVSNPQSVAALVQSSGYFNENVSKEPVVLMTAAIYAAEPPSEDLMKLAVEYALKAGAKGDDLALKLLWTKAHLVSCDQDIDLIFENINTPLSYDLVKLAGTVEPGKHIKSWLKSCVIELTKVFAEEQPLEKYNEAARELMELFAKVGIWQFVSSRYLNSLVDAALSDKGVYTELNLFVAAQVVFSAEKTHGIEHTRHLQRLVNLEWPRDEEDPQMVAYCCMLAWKLFSFDAARNSSRELQRKLVLRYSGSDSAAGQLVVCILKECEEQTRWSWAEEVVSWDIWSESNSSEYEVPALVDAAGGDGLSVVLSKAKLRTMRANYDPLREFSLAKVQDLSFSGLVQAMHQHEIEHPSCAYDEEFLMGCIVSHEQVLHKDGSVDVKFLAESGLLWVVICCLSSERANVLWSAQQLLGTVYTSLAKKLCSYKEEIAMKLLVGKILDFTCSERVPGYLSVMLGYLCEVVVHPGHYVYEQACDFLLGGPGLVAKQVPLFKVIGESGHEHQAKQILWLLDALTASVLNYEAVVVFGKQGVYEWAFELVGVVVPQSGALKRAVEALVRKTILVGGAPILISRFGGLVWPAPCAELIYACDPGDLKRWLV